MFRIRIVNFIVRHTVTPDFGKGTGITGVMLSLDLQEESYHVVGTGISTALPSWGEQKRGAQTRQFAAASRGWEMCTAGTSSSSALSPQIPKPNPLPSALLPEKLHDLMNKKVFEAAFPLHEVRLSTQCLGGKSRRDGGIGWGRGGHLWVTGAAPRARWVKGTAKLPAAVSELGRALWVP